jgi:hypothetical protein
MLFVARKNRKGRKQTFGVFPYGVFIVKVKRSRVVPDQFFRFEALRYHGKTVAESAAWALNEHGALDSHIPENFAYLHFKD